ncbi:MAG: hypothetical protein HN348_34325 [Proteobacteria bacterium]|nr:hypothetical protein [Pseudomonadota bacterium]
MPHGTDPSVVRVDDELLLMALSQGLKTLIATSADGLAFELTEIMLEGGVTELASTMAVFAALSPAWESRVGYPTTGKLRRGMACRWPL